MEINCKDNLNTLKQNIPKNFLNNKSHKNFARLKISEEMDHFNMSDSDIDTIVMQSKYNKTKKKRLRRSRKSRNRMMNISSNSSGDEFYKDKILSNDNGLLKKHKIGMKKKRSYENSESIKLNFIADENYDPVLNKKLKLLKDLSCNYAARLNYLSKKHCMRDTLPEKLFNELNTDTDKFIDKMKIILRNKEKCSLGNLQLPIESEIMLNDETNNQLSQTVKNNNDNLISDCDPNIFTENDEIYEKDKYDSSDSMSEHVYDGASSDRQPYEGCSSSTNNLNFAPNIVGIIDDSITPENVMNEIINEISNRQHSMAQTNDDSFDVLERNAKQKLLDSESDFTDHEISVTNNIYCNQETIIKCNETDSDDSTVVLINTNEKLMDLMESNSLSDGNCTTDYWESPDSKKNHISELDLIQSDKKLNMACQVRIKKLRQDVIPTNSNFSEFHNIQEQTQYSGIERLKNEDCDSFMNLIDLDNLEKKSKRNVCFNQNVRFSNSREGNNVHTNVGKMEENEESEYSEIDNTSIENSEEVVNSVGSIADIDPYYKMNETAKSKLLESSDYSEEETLDNDSGYTKELEMKPISIPQEDENNVRKEMEIIDLQSQEMKIDDIETSDSDLNKLNALKYKKRGKRHEMKSSDDSWDDDIGITEMNDGRQQETDSNKRNLDSDLDSVINSSSIDFENKRKRKICNSDPLKDEDTQTGESHNKIRRRNIRRVIDDELVNNDTKQAAKEESERLKRIAENQKKYDKIFKQQCQNVKTSNKLVLDFDEKTKKELVTVDKNLLKHLKVHQIQGIKFMWNTCFESINRIKSSEGSGCILAHCMGLGKTLQIIALSHTLLSHKETGIQKIMIVAPLTIISNWLDEFKFWLKDTENYDNIKLYETNGKSFIRILNKLNKWHKTGGILILHYARFRVLLTSEKFSANHKKHFYNYLVNPGPDLIICDEGHTLKNNSTWLNQYMQKIATRRRIILTGTPLQNHLMEYYCMVQFVKPNLLGTQNEFRNRFENPITNGQFDNSTEDDVKLMKKRAHVLHKMLEGCVQRFDYSTLAPFLPPKQEYAIYIRLTPIQIRLYEYYIKRRIETSGSQHYEPRNMIKDYHWFQKLWSHPCLLYIYDLKKRKNIVRDKWSDENDDLIKYFNVNQFFELDQNEIQNKNSTAIEKNQDSETSLQPTEKTINKDWWSEFLKPEDLNRMESSNKFLLLFDILKESEKIGDKILVFSTTLFSLDLIEYFLKKINNVTNNDKNSDSNNFIGKWILGLDYFRLDGKVPIKSRNKSCEIFNKSSNTRARLFLISTRVGGLGINLTAANRVIIFDASWNPSSDTQSIFRTYRFGQTKPCYVYRFLSAGTMEEKIYNRQVTKLSLSHRVLDEQQIERHYTNKDLCELYRLKPYSYENRSELFPPKDPVLAKIFLNNKESIETYHEHDTLLENKEEEKLDELERQQAWVEYEAERKSRESSDITLTSSNHPNVVTNSTVHVNTLEQLIQKDYPSYGPEQVKGKAKLIESNMQNYVQQSQLNTAVDPDRHNLSECLLNNFLLRKFQVLNTSLENQQSRDEIIERQVIELQNIQENNLRQYGINAVANTLMRSHESNSSKYFSNNTIQELQSNTLPDDQQ